MKFDYANFALYGFTILFIIYLYYLKINLKENIYIIFGSLLITVGFFFAMKEKYDYLKHKKLGNIKISHLLLGLFKLLSYVIPAINSRIRKTDVIGLIGNIILVNTNFGYEQLGFICQIIHYSLYTYRNSIKNELLDNIQGVGGGLVLLYYIKKLIDNWYKKREDKIVK